MIMIWQKGFLVAAYLFCSSWWKYITIDIHHHIVTQWNKTSETSIENLEADREQATLVEKTLGKNALPQGWISVFSAVLSLIYSCWLNVLAFLFRWDQIVWRPAGLRASISPTNGPCMQLGNFFRASCRSTDCTLEDLRRLMYSQQRVTLVRWTYHSKSTECPTLQAHVSHALLLVQSCGTCKVWDHSQAGRWTIGKHETKNKENESPVDFAVGLEKFLFMGFPLHRLHVQHLTEEDCMKVFISFQTTIENKSMRYWVLALIQELHVLSGNALSLDLALFLHCSVFPPCIRLWGNECPLSWCCVDHGIELSWHQGILHWSA